MFNGGDIGDDVDDIAEGDEPREGEVIEDFPPPTDEVIDALAKLKKYKATGSDGRRRES